MRRRQNKFILFAAFITAASSAIAKSGDWAESAKAAYVKRCSTSMASQGMKDEQAEKFCRCSIDKQEFVFGVERYKEMMRAQPNANGNRTERELNDILMECSKQHIK